MQQIALGQASRAAALLLITSFILCSCKTSQHDSISLLQQEQSLLAKRQHISFIAMGANHGRGMESPSVRSIVQYTERQQPAFGLGLGNHLASDGRTQFSDVMGRYAWWRHRFFPALAGGENAAYGEGNEDWGAGAKFLHRNQILAKAIRQVSQSGSFRFAARTRPNHRQPLVVSFNEALRSEHGDPVDYVLEYEQDGIQISAFHLYSIQRNPSLAAIDNRSLRWLDRELKRINRLEKRTRRERLTIIFTHGGGSENWLEAKATSAYLQQIFSSVDLILMSSDDSSGQSIQVAPQYYQTFASYKPLILRLPEFSDENPLIIQATVLRSPERLLIRYWDPVARAVNWSRQAYAKDFGRQSHKLQAIESYEQWQRFLRR